MEGSDYMEEEIRHWIQQINDETILPSDIVAFNFGLFESEEGYCIYLTGSKFYDESDDDWACDIDFEPNRKYLMLASGSIQNMNWKQILYKVKNIIFNFITANAYKLPLFSDEAKYAEEENRKLGEIPSNPRMEITKERTSNDRKGTTSKKSKKGNTALMQSAVDTDSIENSNIFGVVEEMPSFPGGMAALMKYIKDNLRYPEICREGAAMGRVHVVFIVNEDGSLSDIKVIRSISPELDKEAIRVVKSMPKWNPAKQNGKAVKMKYVVPVNFRPE